jgi:hypothetical protein
MQQRSASKVAHQTIAANAIQKIVPDSFHFIKPVKHPGFKTCLASLAVMKSAASKGSSSQLALRQQRTGRQYEAFGFRPAGLQSHTAIEQDL